MQNPIKRYLIIVLVFFSSFIHSYDARSQGRSQLGKSSRGDHQGRFFNPSRRSPWIGDLNPLLIDMADEDLETAVQIKQCDLIFSRCGLNGNLVFDDGSTSQTAVVNFQDQKAARKNQADKQKGRNHWKPGQASFFL